MTELMKTYEKEVGEKIPHIGLIESEYIKLKLENIALKSVLSRIAAQKLEHEVEAEEWEGADFECAYDSIVREARAVLRDGE